MTEWTDRRIAWVLFAAGFAALFFTELPIGFTRDESVYFYSAESHARWFQTVLSNPSVGLTDGAIAPAYEYNREHPGLMKNLFGLSFLVFHEKLALVRPATAFRIPAFLFGALILPLTFGLGRRLFGRAAGVAAAISFFLVPRQFFNAHLSCFDVPITAMWLLTIYCFVRAQEEKRWWLFTGIAFGCALATKHNALFIPVAVTPIALRLAWVTSKEKAAARSKALQVAGVFLFGSMLYVVLVLAQGGDGFVAKFEFLSPATAIFLLMAGVGGWRLWALGKEDDATFRAMGPLVAMAVLGPVFFYVNWPYLWAHPVDRTAWFLNFHATHNHYAWFYLGKVLREPPFPLEYVVFKTALTVPTPIFVPMVFGFLWTFGRAVTRKASVLERVVLVNAMLSIVVISAPSVPHFGGVKHWFPSMPFLSILAAGSVLRGAEGLHAWLGAKIPKATAQHVFIGVAVLLGLAPLVATARIYQFGTSAYSELAGGLPGAASLGMQRQFWANNVTGVLDWLNQNARPGERVYFHECHNLQTRDYVRNKMVREDIRFVGGPEQADIVLYQYHQEFREAEFNTWQAFGTTQPVTGLYLDETPQIVVYRRK